MSLSVNNLTILDNRNQPLFAPVSFTVAQGEIFTLMGPSGCGKSSLLSVIAGHTSADFSYQGECYYQQQLLNNLPAEKRNIGILF